MLRLSLKKTTLFAIFVFLSVQLYTQRFLVVKNTTKYRNYKYFTGDVLMFKTKNDSISRAGQITSFADSSLVVNYSRIVYLNDFEFIYRKRFFFGFFSHAFRYFGATYFGLTGLNRTINKDYPIYDKNSILISTSTFATGLILNYFSNKRLKIQDNYKLEILDLRPDN